MDLDSITLNLARVRGCHNLLVLFDLVACLLRCLSIQVYELWTLFPKLDIYLNDAL
jgi:hypothetical protein